MRCGVWDVVRVGRGVGGVCVGCACICRGSVGQKIIHPSIPAIRDPTTPPPLLPHPPIPTPAVWSQGAPNTERGVTRAAERETIAFCTHSPTRPPNTCLPAGAKQTHFFVIFSQPFILQPPRPLAAVSVCDVRRSDANAGLRQVGGEKRPREGNQTSSLKPCLFI